MRDSLIALAALGVVFLAGRLLFRRLRRGSAPLHVPSLDGTFTLKPPRKNALLLGATALVPAGLLGAVTYLGRIGGWAAFVVERS
jgi:hypothetical protein